MQNHNKDRLPAGLWLVGLAAAAMVLLWAGGPELTEVLKYRRSAILDGEWWRLVTGHAVHGGFRHMALNVAGGILMTVLFLRTFSMGHWLLVLAVSLVAIDAGFLLRDRWLESYVGFSGVLHGVLAAGSIAWWRTEPKFMAIAISAITVAKLGWEQWEGPVSLAGDGMRIIVNAHLYGAIGGALIAGLLIARGALDRPTTSLTADPTV